MAFSSKYMPGGRWANLHETRAIVDILERIAGSFGRGRARLLVLGCGTTTFVEDLSPETYESLIGVDLADKAIALARDMKIPDPGKVRFEVGDMCTFEADRPQHMIVLLESIYYVRKPRKALALIRSLRQKNPEAVFVVTIADPWRYRKHIEMVRKNFTVTEDVPVQEGNQRHLLVFN
jgi:SAM-dependent methyltransferase